ncbi:hypothetical protein TanjilG_30840 [Lupinus angustifolius]|uniref:DUF7032 domain-containing protein n=1 Tax=Lupinus angustifolius TaxID=3871 RepID=A0A394D8L7_LUPAN|nr:PREDICTED: uncharacterized protein LOC109337543 [Lupinus angustifolius]OIW19926.1 hypothetical protein TanjilG_30840 [Lupinus angustifolius]
MKDSSSPDADPITVSLNSLSSLLDHEIPTVHHFKGKWSLARVKLTLLQTHLTDFSTDFPNSSHPLSLDLFLSISHTLHDAVSLVHHSQSLNLQNGKLKTQNDLDSLLSKLHCHVTDCDILFRSGVLNENQNAAVSTSRNETVRSESRNLITRLQIGSPESRTSAMDSLLTLLNEDDKNVTIAVAQGIVPVLVRLLDYSPSSSEMKEKTVAAVSRVSSVDSSKNVLIAEGLLLLNHLLRVLDSGTGFGIEKACIALQALSFSKENARAIGSRGGISSLLEICQAGTPGSQASAAGVLRNLAAFEEILENLVEENAVVVLLGLASSGTSLAQENAIGCLSSLISETESLRVLVVEEGGIEILKNFWDSAGLTNKGLEVAVEILRVLALSAPIAEVLVSEGFVARLVGVLNCGVLAVRIVAGRAVYALGLSGGTKARKEMGECGCIVPLIKMLDGKAVEEKEVAVMALSVLLSHTANRRVFRKDEKGVVSVVQLLNPSLQGLDKKYPVSLLALLVHSKSCRKQMVAAGACVHTQKLVEMDIEGSKKLLESLGRGKIWGVFARP